VHHQLAHCPGQCGLGAAVIRAGKRAGGGDDDGEAEDRVGATVSVTALHAVGSARETRAAVAFEAHQREIAVPQFRDAGSPGCQATGAKR